MRISLFACLVISLFIGVQVSAAEIQHIHVISHKEWTTGNARGSFKVSNQSNPGCKAIEHASSRCADRDILLFNDLPSVAANIGEPIVVKAMQSVMLNNNSASIKTYDITYTLCAVGKDVVERCVDALDRVEINAAGHYEYPVESQLMLDPSWAADTYVTVAVTGVKSLDDAMVNVESDTPSSVTIS